MTMFVENRVRAGDRRQNDLGPPDGYGERRLVADRRLPQVEEFSISEADWQKLFGHRPATASAEVEKSVELPDTPRSVH